MELHLNDREALLVVTALGTFQNRVGQHASWYQRNRMRTLRARLADAITIDDVEETLAIKKAITKTTRRIERIVNLGLEISQLRERIKSEAGIHDEKVTTYEDDEL